MVSHSARTRVRKCVRPTAFDAAVTTREEGAMAAGPAVEPRRFNHFAEIAGFLWQIADLLRGDHTSSPTTAR